jgi:Rrf2 family protein
VNLTSRSRYALKIMLDLAHRQDEPLVRRKDIVNRQGIPSKYLDQILVRLRRDGLVASVRGRTGGYRIGRDIHSISVWEIFRAVEDGIYPVACVDELHTCEFKEACVAAEPWQLIFETMRNTLTQMSLAAFEHQFAREDKMCPMGGLRECRPGREPLRNMDAGFTESDLREANGSMTCPTT